MYNDYPVIYESTVNQFISYWVILGILSIIILIVTFISLAKIFKKANRSAISAWIPLYNLYTLIEITNLPKYYLLLILIPIINIPIIIITTMSLAKMFKKSKLFGIGLLLLPFIFYPILGFSSSEYIGINLVAMEGKNTIEDIPVIDLNKNQKIEVEVNDQADEKSTGINISIGGGVYQKQYTSNLIDVDKEKVLTNNQAKPDMLSSQQPTSTFINDIQPTPNVTPTPTNDLFSVSYINTTPQQPTSVTNNTAQQISNPNMNNSQPIPQTNTVQPASSNSNPSIVKYKTCPNCGANVNEDSNTCFICGSNF